MKPIAMLFKIVPHKTQRYDTVGDWYMAAGVTQFSVSKMKDERYCWLVFFHEFVEWGLCRIQGVKQRQVDQFDLAYEKTRDESETAPCGCKHHDEPGADDHAPYHSAHVAAMACEKILAEVLGVEWTAYEAAIENL